MKIDSPIDMKLLEAFRTVVDQKTVTQAANVLGITQPAVSTQIARLEQLVGFSLFERTANRLKPTAEGMLFYAEVTRALSEFDRLSVATSRIRDGQSGRLVIASHPSAAISLLPKLVTAFLAERPDVDVRLITRHSPIVSQIFSNVNFDIGIAELPIDETSIRLTRHQMRCVAILPPGHPLVDKTVVTPKLLSPFPMVAPVRALQVALRLRSTFANAGLPLKAVAEAEFFASLCGLVAAGCGWSLVDPLSAETFQHLGLVIRPFEPAIQYEIGIFTHNDRENSLLTQAFLDLIDKKLRA